jgi:hypothetical protein
MLAKSCKIQLNALKFFSISRDEDNDFNNDNNNNNNTRNYLLMS